MMSSLKKSFITTTCGTWPKLAENRKGSLKVNIKSVGKNELALLRKSKWLVQADRLNAAVLGAGEQCKTSNVTTSTCDASSIG